MAQAVETRATTSEHIIAIRDRYLAEAREDAVLALNQALSDALADLYGAQRRTRARDRLVSRGYVRGRTLDAD